MRLAGLHGRKKEGESVTTCGHVCFSGSAGQAENFLFAGVAIADEYVVDSDACAINLLQKVNSLTFNNLTHVKSKGLNGKTPLRAWVETVNCRKKSFRRCASCIYQPFFLVKDSHLYRFFLTEPIYDGCLRAQVRYAKSA